RRTGRLRPGSQGDRGPSLHRRRRRGRRAQALLRPRNSGDRLSRDPAGILRPRDRSERTSAGGIIGLEEIMDRAVWVALPPLRAAPGGTRSSATRRPATLMRGTMGADRVVRLDLQGAMAMGYDVPPPASVIGLVGLRRPGTRPKSAAPKDRSNAASRGFSWPSVWWRVERA